MNRNPKILTARELNVKDWINNTTSIFNIITWPRVSNNQNVKYKFPLNLITQFNINDVIIGVKLFKIRKGYNVIITNSILQSLTYILLHIFSRKSNTLHILNEIYFQEPIKIRQKIKTIIYKIFLKNVDYIRTSSKGEIENYAKILNINKSKFWFLPFPSPVANPKIMNSKENFIIAAGKQYRDYSTLVNAVRTTDYELTIISDYSSLKDVKISDKVTVYYDIRKEEYLDLLIKSKFMIVPLNNDFCSCGQIAMLEAMSYGKPVIAARVTGTMDYIKDGVTGLFYKMGDYQDLREKINLLYRDEKLRNHLALNALSEIRNNLNEQVFVSSYLQFIKDEWASLNNHK